jgi:hypothetical protein
MFIGLDTKHAFMIVKWNESSNNSVVMFASDSLQKGLSQPL